MNNIPYTYLIGWSTHNLWYYGVRYAKDCHPSDLWVKYKTSSKYVDNTVSLYGEPDVVQIRRTFTSEKKARIWEEKVLRRMNVVTMDQWINKTSNRAFTPMYGDDNPMRRANVIEKHKQTINGEQWLTHRRISAADPIVRAKISGENHYSKKDGYECKTKGDNNPMKRIEVAKKAKDNLPSRIGEMNARSILTESAVRDIRKELTDRLPENPKYGQAEPVYADIAMKYGVSSGTIKSIRFNRIWKNV